MKSVVTARYSCIKGRSPKLKTLSQEKGLTLIPLGMYLKNGYVKVKVAVAKGKRSYDKRSALKDREHKRDIDRAMKNQS